MSGSFIQLKSKFNYDEKSPLYQLFVSMLIVLGAGIILFSIFLIAGSYIFNGNLELLNGTYSEASEKDISFIKYILISQQISLFIVPAIILLVKFKPENQPRLIDLKFPQLKEVVFVIILAFCIFPLTSFTGQLNSGIHLPEWLSGVEQWITDKEESATRLLDLILSSDTFGSMMFNLLLIAVLPAIGEELIFRGVFQKILYKLFKSGHIAIWVTAFIFSALHLQFFGFVPRFILGLIFGYLFFWSGTLWIPVIAHFVNNAVPVIGSYIQGWEKYNTSEIIPMWKQIMILPLPIIAGTIILLYFKNKSWNEKNLIKSQEQLTDNLLSP